MAIYYISLRESWRRILCIFSLFLSISLSHILYHPNHQLINPSSTFVQVLIPVSNNIPSVTDLLSLLTLMSSSFFPSLFIEFCGIDFKGSCFLPFLFFAQRIYQFLDVFLFWCWLCSCFSYLTPLLSWLSTLSQDSCQEQQETDSDSFLLHSCKGMQNLTSGKYVPFDDHSTGERKRDRKRHKKRQKQEIERSSEQELKSYSQREIHWQISLHLEMIFMLSFHSFLTILFSCSSCLFVSVSVCDWDSRREEGGKKRTLLDRWRRRRRRREGSDREGNSQGHKEGWQTTQYLSREKREEEEK